LMISMKTRTIKTRNRAGMSTSFHRSDAPALPF